MHARDPADLYKDRIEVSLDGRQIFYLFFGGAVIVGLVFVLGVMVGRRIETRGHVDPARTAAAADPLAALDRLEGPDSLSFKGTLTGAQAPTEVERKIDELAEKKPEPKADPRPEPKADPRPEPKADPRPEPKAEKKPEPKLEKAEPKPQPKAEPKLEKAEPKPEARAEKRDGKDARDGKDGKKKKRSDGEASDSGTRYTLQLSSFQDREEAQAFLSSLRAAGFHAYVTEVDVGGKGTFYRVRHGAYRSAEAASDAKAELERITRKTATVMKL